MPKLHSLSSEYKKAVKKVVADIEAEFADIAADADDLNDWLTEVQIELFHNPNHLFFVWGAINHRNRASAKDLRKLKDYLGRVRGFKRAYEIREWLRERKQKLGLTNKQMAEKLCRDERTVERYLSRGSVDSNVISRLRDKFGLTFDEYWQKINAEEAILKKHPLLNPPSLENLTVVVRRLIKDVNDREAFTLLQQFANKQYESVFYRHASTVDDAYVYQLTGYRLNAVQSKIVIDLINNEGEPLVEQALKAQSKSAKRRGDVVGAPIDVWKNAFCYREEDSVLFNEKLF